MSFIDADVLKSVIGSVAAGPAGFGVGYEVTGGANVAGNSIGVEVSLNQQSLTSAKAQLESGENIQVAKTLEPPKASKSLSTISDRRSSADNKYAALVSSVGLSPSAERGLTKGAWSHKPDYRSSLTPKNPLLRIRQRQLLQLRKTFDEIGHAKTKNVVINTDTLPQHILEKRAEAAVAGTAPNRAKAAGFNPAEWRRWGHSLIGGSAPDAMPSPRPG